MTDRISSASFHQQNLRHITDGFLTLAELNKQISSGRIADNYVDLNGSIERISSFEVKISRNESYVGNNNTVKTRLNAMNTALEQLQDIASAFKAEITSADALRPEANLAQNSRATISKILDQVNIDLGGRYLFSGSRTDVAPVTDPPTTLVPGTADDSYYNGNSKILSARVSDSLELPYGVTADEQAFQDLISAVNTAINAAENANRETLNQASDLVDSAITGLSQIRARVNSSLVIIDDVNFQHERVNLLFRESLSEEIDTDIAEASIKLTSEQTILQATFSAFARISELKLTNFLN